MDTKTWRSLKRLRKLLLGSIPIIYKCSKNKNNEDRDQKAKIYYISLKLYYSVCILASLLLILRKKDTNYVIVLLDYTKDSIKLIFVNSDKRYFFPILTSFIVDYKD